MVVVSKDTKVYRIGRLTFVLLPEMVLVKTPLQAFYLMPTEPRSNKRLRVIRIMIELGEIRNLNELAGWTRPNIIWTSLQTFYDISNCEVIER